MAKTALVGAFLSTPKREVTPPFDYLYPACWAFHISSGNDELDVSKRRVYRKPSKTRRKELASVSTRSDGSGHTYFVTTLRSY